MSLSHKILAWPLSARPKTFQSFDTCALKSVRNSLEETSMVLILEVIISIS